MFFVRREKKAALLVMGAMVLTLVKIPGVPLQHANFLLQAAFLLSELGGLSRHLRALRHTRFPWKVLLLVGFSVFLAVFTSPYVNPKHFIQSELLFNYFALAYAFWAVKDENSLRPVLRVSLYCLLVLTAFGVPNYIDGSARFVNALTEGQESIVHKGVALGDVFKVEDRFRVQSMFRHPFDYGYICAVMLILHMHGRYRRLETKRAFVIALVCCLFGIVTCGCRIVWVGALLSIVCYSMWAFRLNRAAVYGMTAIILMIMSYYAIPAVEERVNMVTDIFIEDGETTGSSVQLRMSQYAEVVYRIQGEEWLGLGKGYWGYIYSEDQSSVEDLLGIESVILAYLLERGIIGLAIWAIFYIVISRYFWKNRKKNKALTGLGAAVLTLYLTFSLGTGELNSVYPTMLLLGFAIKGVEKSGYSNGSAYRPRRRTPQSLRAVDSTRSAELTVDSTRSSTFGSPNLGEQRLPQVNSQLSNINSQFTKPLAIIIPAYKATFLPAALDSIAAQTCKDFTVYIGDDYSPEPIGVIVERYRDKIDLVYQRFDTNWGGNDLVAQWERCIAMSQKEPYIWLFSDDDVMEPNCVEQLLRTIHETQGAYDLYHFDSYRIDENGKFELLRNPYPSVLSSYDYYKGKMTGKYDSYVVENVFSRRIYEQSGGFRNFDLAWGSDVATWCIFCGSKGMRSVPGALIGWRRSSRNITPDKSRKAAERKLMADCAFLCWSYIYYHHESDIWRVNRRRFIALVGQYKKRVGRSCVKEAKRLFYGTHGHRGERLCISFLIALPRKLRKYIMKLW